MSDGKPRKELIFSVWLHWEEMGDSPPNPVFGIILGRSDQSLSWGCFFEASLLEGGSLVLDLSDFSFLGPFFME
jgi:hypothetical protein